MKKQFSLLLASLLVLASCDQAPVVPDSINQSSADSSANQNDGTAKQPVQSNPNLNSKDTIVNAADLQGTVWFSGDSELQFPYADETLYIKYLPDSLNITQWISLKQNENGTYSTKIEWSENVREIGKTCIATITKKSGLLSVKSDLFEFSNMSTYEGITATDFDISKVPPLKADYLSNFSGKYPLKETNYELSISAKLCISESVNKYWNANILNTQVDNGTYDLLLAHSSAKDASGSIDPGITGEEPFVTKQGLFWSHLTLTPKEGSQWTVKWSSTWYNSPYEALNGELDMSDTFTGPATTKITYKYSFYFGNPKLKDSGYGVEAENTSLIKKVTFDSELPTTETWKEIIARADKITIPEGKLADYWWYNTKSLSPLMDSCVYKLTDSWTPALYEYDFYCALKDKPVAGDIYTVNGTYKLGETATIVITDSTISYTGATGTTDFTLMAYNKYSDTTNPAGDTLPLQVMYLVKDMSEKIYNLRIDYYINKGTSSYNYIKAYNPPITAETTSTEWKSTIGDYSFTGRIKNYDLVTQ